MIIPINPINFTIFPSCIHIIAFLDDEDIESIEFFDYSKGPNGKALELVITDSNKMQCVYTNSERAYMNLMYIGRKVILSNISYEKKVDRTGNIECIIYFEEESFKGKMKFKSLFPPSNYHSGVVDPKGHAKKGLPLIYSSENTFAIECSVVINGDVKKVRKSYDPNLVQFNALEAFLSNNFYLATIGFKNKNEELVKINGSTYLYSAGENCFNYYKYDDLNKKIIYTSDNFPDNYKIEYILTNELNGENKSISQCKVVIDNETELEARFNPEISISDKEICEKRYDGEISIHLIRTKVDFLCEYSISSNIHNKNGNTEIKSNHICKYHNKEWQELSRELKCVTECIINQDLQLLRFNSMQIVEE